MINVNAEGLGRPGNAAFKFRSRSLANSKFALSISNVEDLCIKSCSRSDGFGSDLIGRKPEDMGQQTLLEFMTWRLLSWDEIKNVSLFTLSNYSNIILFVFTVIFAIVQVRWKIVSTRFPISPSVTNERILVSSDLMIRICVDSSRMR